MMSKSKKKADKEEKRPIDVHFERYSQVYAPTGNKPMLYFRIPLIAFGVSGLIWFIPFPYLSFLGQYNGFINWFTLFMAIIVYFYLKLSPTLSYAMLLTFGLFSYLIVQLEYLEKAGGPTAWMVCLLIFFIGMVGQLWQMKQEHMNISISKMLNSWLIGPIWLWSLVFKKMRIPY